ncbi:hypothetical protein [Actinophytocola glycyrrhizae]|uniref:Uncharacterized protein n=1 Tax=Actinophytocola glycyrrhizae TaxID=2044873 RepID=A0ABV9S156_9PSEU
MTADALLDLAGERGFRWRRFRAGRHGPELLAGVYQWADCADVLVIRDAEHAHAYRAPTGPAIDVLAPTHVYWWYGDYNLVWTLRAVLTLAPPGEPDAPAHLTVAAPAIGARLP